MGIHSDADTSFATPVSLGLSCSDSSRSKQRYTRDTPDRGPARASSIKRRFTTIWTRRRRVDTAPRDDKDEIADESLKGPVGLRLLHQSPEPLIDLIFVHGLKGDSVKTWRRSGEPRSFWPQLWLPKEAGFEYTNIHTFGYDSDWANSKSGILDIRDFGQGLLEEMRNAPQLRDRDQVCLLIKRHLARDRLRLTEAAPHHTTRSFYGRSSNQEGEPEKFL